MRRDPFSAFYFHLNSCWASPLKFTASHTYFHSHHIFVEWGHLLPIRSFNMLPCLPSLAVIVVDRTAQFSDKSTLEERLKEAAL